jgi:CIC family chloride channel protein
MLGGLLVGVIGIEIPRILGAGYATLQASLEGQLAVATLALLLFAKLAATSLTLASGGSGGIFTPSLFLGAATGGLFGMLLHDAFPAWTASSGAYALVTMGAMVAATTHAPITAIIMIFEMTKSIAIIPPLMVACVISTIVAAHLRRESIYTAKLLRRGVDLLAEKEANVLKLLRVRDVIDREPVLIAANTPLAEILDLVVRSRHDEFFVVDDKKNLLGAVGVPGLRRLLFDHETLSAVVVAADLVEVRPTVTEDDDLDTVLQLLANTGAAELAVVDVAAGHRVVGAVLERDVLSAFHGETLRRDLAGGFATRVGVARRGREVPLGGGYLLADLPVPPSLVGKSLRELDVRARTGIQVLLVRSRGNGEDAIRVPSPDDRLAPGDRVVVAGRAESVERLGRGLT